MFAQRLVDEIDVFRDSLYREAPLFVKAQRGELSGTQVEHYLENILYLIRHTPEHLKLAAETAAARAEPQLSAFFAEKLAEEDGHDKWAEEDLQALRAKLSLTTNQNAVTTAMRDLVALSADHIATNPRRYLGYVLFVEYLTVTLGPTWLSDLESKCGISKSMMTVIGNHSELDVLHVQDDIKAIDQILNDPAAFAEVLTAVRQSMDCYGRFCSEVAQ